MENSDEIYTNVKHHGSSNYYFLIPTFYPRNSQGNRHSGTDI